MKGMEIKKILKDKGYSLKSVADALNESPQNLYSLLAARDIKTGVVERIARAIGQPVSLFFPELPGLMDQTQTAEQDAAVAEGICRVSEAAEAERIGIPLIPVEAMAGIAAGSFQIMERECERYVVPMFRDADFLIAVRGNSMTPKYNSGDVVACKSLPLSDLFFQWNNVYVIDTTQGSLIKRIKKTSDPDRILIVSENPQYEPFELHKSQINAVALVIGVIRAE